MTPEELQRLLQSMIDEGFVTQVYKLASVKEAQVLNDLRDASLDVYTIQELQRLPTSALDPFADAHLRSARRQGAIAGVTYGAFGILTAVPELVHLMASIVRTAQRLSLTYGQEYESFRGNLELWEAIAKAFGVAPETFEGVEPTGFGQLPVPVFNTNQVRWNPIIFGIARKVLVSIGYIFLKKRWARAVPVVGMGLSGLGNYNLLKRVGLDLKTEFRQRHQLLGVGDNRSSVPIDFRVG